jgi:3-oxoacyl-[acyl-carrier protein] reductase
MTAINLAAQGCDVCLNYIHNEQKAQALAAYLRTTYGVRAGALQADVADAAQVTQLTAWALAESRTGTIDIVVNNAGPYLKERLAFHEYDAADIVRLVHGNLLSALLVDHALLPGMRAQGYGRIFHMGFAHAAEGRAWPFRSVFAAAKTGLVSFTMTLAAEEADSGIAVFMICPGDIVGANKVSTIAAVRQTERSFSSRDTPYRAVKHGRSGCGEDIARTIRFLCAPDSDYLTGSILDVSGGLDPIMRGF